MILDGTFLRADELHSMQAGMGHPPVTESRPLLPASRATTTPSSTTPIPLADRATAQTAVLDPTAASMAEDRQVLEI